MDLEFKEKTYEKYFYGELRRHTQVCYSPDQCDEHHLGFDDAFFLQGEFLGGLHRFLRRAKWERQTGIRITDLEYLAEALQARMPPFRFNLFVQYKRPEYMTLQSSKEWVDWGKAYYRYHLDQHQQKLLEALDSKAQGRAATVYASPSFWTSDDLWNHVAASAVCQYSNIASAGLLANHHRYTYSGPGFRGRGHSEPEDIESIPFAELLQTASSGSPSLFREHLSRTATLIKQAVEELGLQNQLGSAVSAIASPEAMASELVRSIVTIEAFKDAFGIYTYMIG
ncbi:hypothetical protein [Rhizobium leguminosarum]|uniref:hypothetical protein n=1 Tax=Rhizobium leguminosarum TaxID=384 RepID=UPI0010315A45|nr:hypothetical protein [Rhizobium leguminosarum]TAZ00093.1 hypothetical protein ELH79_17070 [Rhizobium leguminosarum]TAZ10960.1 hypothetical protein ELH78_17950 [Rhizobium leguminosarum]